MENEKKTETHASLLAFPLFYFFFKVKVRRNSPMIKNESWNHLDSSLSLPSQKCQNKHRNYTAKTPSGNQQITVLRCNL